MYSANDAIDIWIVERALGQGGMGSVYRCHNRDARRILAAIKVLDYGLKRSPKARARFVREAEILFSLDHPHIVKVRNVRLDADPPYLEMEFVEGASLERRIMEGPVDAESMTRWLGQLASALAYLHGRGIRHRDIKPSNILVNVHGHATLVDFGIATEADGSTLSESGQAMGSVAYVPPEWVHIGLLDPVKWDLYALGVCAYEALTGRTAFGVPSGGMSTQRFYQVLTAKQGHPPLDPGPDVPFGLRELVRDMTRAEPDERIPSADAVVARVKALDLRDIRPDHVFPDGGPPPPGVGGRVDTPRGLTMVPDRESWEAPAAPTPRDTFVHAPAPTPPAAPAPAARSFGPLLLAGAAAMGAALVAVVGLGLWILRPADTVPPAPTATPAPTAPAPATPAPTAPAPVEPTAPAPPVPTAPAAPAAEPAAGPPPSPAPPADAPSAPTRPPAAPVATPTPAPGADAPAPPADAPAATAGAPVTNAQLARWIEAHPDWAKDAAIAAGRADEKYLRGWEGGAPPAGKEGAPAVAVTWSLAKAYCASRGGLAPADAAPHTWKESASQPWMEYRQSDGAPRWRRDDGVVSDQVSIDQSGVFIGFRCAR